MVNIPVFQVEKLSQGHTEGTGAAWLTISFCLSPVPSCAPQLPAQVQNPSSPGQSQHSPCPCVPSPRKPLRETTFHSAPHRSERSGCQQGRVAGKQKRKEKASDVCPAPSLLPGSRDASCSCLVAGIAGYTTLGIDSTTPLPGAQCTLGVKPRDPESLKLEKNVVLCPEMATLQVTFLQGG
jgi:hypothetical protein